MLDNPIIQALNSVSQSQNSIMLQAVGAMLRGETPQSFLQNLAKNTPELKGLDLSNPSQAAEKLYKEKGQDINQAKASIRDRFNNFLK